MSDYFVEIYTKGAQWITGKTVLEQSLEAHFAYISGLQSRGILVLGSPFKDDEGALAIVIVSNSTEAQLVFATDPVITQEIFKVSVHHWFVSISGETTQKPW